MPRPSPDGLHVAHGVGGGDACIDNAAFSFGAVLGWKNDHTVVFVNGDDNWYVSLYDVRTGAIVRAVFGPSNQPLQLPMPVRPFSRSFTRSPYQLALSANAGYAGGDIYAIWYGSNDPALTGLWASTGWHNAHAGLLNVGPAGAIAYKPEYQSNGPSMVRELDGTDWKLTDGNADWLSMHPNNQVLFLEMQKPIAVNMPMPVWAPGGIWRAEAVFLAGEWWMIPYYANHGIVAHPFRTLDEGYPLLPKGDGWHACVAIDATTLRIYVATSEGEQAGQIWVRDLDVTRNLVRDPWGDNQWLPILKVPVLDINKPEAPPPVPTSGTVTIADDWGPRSGPAPLTVAMRAEWTGDVAWIQWLRAEVGGAWQLDALRRDPRIDDDHHMVFEQEGAHVIGVQASDATGNILDTTGANRIVTVTAPAPPKPEPTPMHPERFRYCSNISTPDLLAMFDRPNDWSLARARMGVLVMYIQHILEIGPIGLATYSELVKRDAFRWLTEQGVAFGLEAGAIKEGDWDGNDNMDGLCEAAKRIAAAGGVLYSVTMDEPLTAAKKKPGGIPLPTCADVVAEYIALGESFGAKVGWAEASPNIDLETQRQFLQLLDERGKLPHFWHQDIDSHDMGLPAVETHLRNVMTIAGDYGMPVGVYLAGYPATTDSAYVQQTLQWAQEVRTRQPLLAHVIVQSWATRGDHGAQDVPRNLSETELDSQTALFNKVVELFS